jgi:hypothetical protein
MARRSNESLRPGPSRRGFLDLKGIGGAALLSALAVPLAYGDAGPLDANQRRQRAFTIRRDAAIFRRDRESASNLVSSARTPYRRYVSVL